MTNRTNAQHDAAVLKAMFVQINADCARDGDPVVPFSDVDYYVDQLQNVLDCDAATARAIAVTFTQD